MSDNLNLDPSTLGFFIVAAISLPLAMVMLSADITQGLSFFFYAGIAILLVGLLAWKCGSNFGFTVFSLVGLAVMLTGNGMIGEWGNIAFGLIFVFTVVWSHLAGNGRNLTLLLVTTALIFLLVGAQTITDSDLSTVIGIVAILNFLLNFYMACSCAFPEKFKAF